MRGKLRAHRRLVKIRVWNSVLQRGCTGRVQEITGDGGRRARGLKTLKIRIYALLRVRLHGTNAVVVRLFAMITSSLVVSRRRAAANGNNMRLAIFFVITTLPDFSHISTSSISQQIIV